MLCTYMAANSIYSHRRSNTPWFHFSPEPSREDPQTNGAKISQVQTNKEMPQKIRRWQRLHRDSWAPSPELMSAADLTPYHLRRESSISPDTSTALPQGSGFYLLPPPAKTVPRVKGSLELQGISGRKAPGPAVYSCLGRMLSNLLPCSLRGNSREKWSHTIRMVI